MALEFEWDLAKAELQPEGTWNLLRRGDDGFSGQISDPDHSDSEDRFIDIGMSHRMQLLVVSYTERKDKIRIISARRATRAERKNYEETD
jgi:uncharacterized protein